MIKTVNFSDFCDEFSKTETYKNNFSYEGKRALFDYLERLEEDTSNPIELDIVALCCEYSEYESAYEAMKQYQPEDMPIAEDTGVDENGRGQDLTEIQEAEEAMALEWLEDRTQVIPVEGGRIIILDF